MIKSPALPAGSMVNCPKCGKAFRLGGSDEPVAKDQRTNDGSTKHQAPSTKQIPNPKSQIPNRPIPPPPPAPRTPTPPPPPPPENVVPQEAASAAVTTQPAHRAT